MPPPIDSVFPPPANASDLRHGESWLRLTMAPDKLICRIRHSDSKPWLTAKFVWPPLARMLLVGWIIGTGLLLAVNLAPGPALLWYEGVGLDRDAKNDLALVIAWNLFAVVSFFWFRSSRRRDPAALHAFSRRDSWRIDRPGVRSHLLPEGPRFILTHEGHAEGSFEPIGRTGDWALHVGDGSPEATAGGDDRAPRPTSVLGWVLAYVGAWAMIVLPLLARFGPIESTDLGEVMRFVCKCGVVIYLLYRLDQGLRYPSLLSKIRTGPDREPDPRIIEEQAFRDWLTGRLRTILWFMSLVLVFVAEIPSLAAVAVGLHWLAKLARPDPRRIDIVAGDRTIGLVRHVGGKTTLDLITGPGLPAPDRLAILAFLAAR